MSSLPVSVPVDIQGKVTSWKLKIEAKIMEIITKECMKAVQNLAADCMKLDNAINPMASLGALAKKAAQVVSTVNGAVNMVNGAINTVQGAAGAALGALGVALAAAGQAVSGAGGAEDAIQAAAAAGEAAGNSASAQSDALSSEASEGDSQEEEVSSEFISLEDSVNKIISNINKAKQDCSNAEKELSGLLQEVKSNTSKYWKGSGKRGIWTIAKLEGTVQENLQIFQPTGDAKLLQALPDIETKISQRITGKLAEHINGATQKLQTIMADKENKYNNDDNKKKPPIFTEVGFVIGDLTAFGSAMKEVLGDLLKFHKNEIKPAIPGLQQYVKTIIAALKNPLSPKFGMPYDTDIEEDLKGAETLDTAVQKKLSNLEELVGSSQEQMNSSKKPSSGKIPMEYWNIQQETNKIPKSS